MPATNIALLNRANALLSKATTLDDLKEVRDVSEAARTFAKAAQLGLDLQNRAAELKLRAERKAGAILAQLRLHGGDRRSKSHDATLKLAEIGLSKHQSARWQLAAAVPEAEFEEFVRETCAGRQELTAAGLLRIARSRLAKSTVRKPTRRNVSAGIAAPIDRSELLSLLDDISQHGEALESLLEPVCNGGLPGIGVAERRYVARLLKDIRHSVSALRARLWTAE